MSRRASPCRRAFWYWSGVMPVAARKCSYRQDVLMFTWAASAGIRRGSV
jgi:hypothetical protein